MKKTLIRIFLLVLTTFVVCISFDIPAVDAAVSTGDVNAHYEYDQAYCDTFTDSDIINNYNNYTIRDYAARLAGQNISKIRMNHLRTLLGVISYDVTVSSRYDPIINIIPLEMFIHRGEYIHLGLEYGFYIKTTQGGVGASSNVSQVMVFDITTEFDKTRPNQMLNEIKPLFEFKYYYLQSYDWLRVTYAPYPLYCEDFNYTSSSYSSILVIELDKGNMAEQVVPNNSNSNLYLTDINFQSSLRNNQHLNVGDNYYNPYSPYDDLGSFFSSMILNYKGRSGNFGLTGSGYRALLEYGLGFVPGVSDVLSIAGLFGVDTSLILGEEEVNSYQGQIVKNNNHSQLEQIEHIGQLAKQMYLGIGDYPSKSPLIYGQGDYFSCSIGLGQSVTGAGSQLWNTEVRYAWSLTIYKGDAYSTQGELLSASRTFEYDARGTETKNLSLNEYVLTYVLPGKADRFVYVASQHNYYDFNISTLNDVIVTPKINGVYQEPFVANGSWRVELRAGDHYEFDISSDTKQIFTTVVNCRDLLLPANSTTNLSLARNETSEYILYPSSSSIYNIITGSNNVFINLYEINSDFTETYLTNNYGRPEISYRLEAGKKYRLVCKVYTNIDFQLKVQATTPINLTLGQKYTNPSAVLSNYQYFKFTPTTTDDYTIASYAVGGRAMVYLYDSNWNLMNVSSGSNPSQKVNARLQANNTYYIVTQFSYYEIIGQYSLQVYKTSEEVYSINWANVPKRYFDYSYIGWVEENDKVISTWSMGTVVSGDANTRTLVFSQIQCSWSINWGNSSGDRSEYYMQLVIGNYTDPFNAILFECYNGYHDYRSVIGPNVWFYSTTVYNVSITFSETEWNSYVTNGPRP